MEYGLIRYKIWLTNIKLYPLFRGFISFLLITGHQSITENHFLIDMGIWGQWLDPEIGGLSELKIWPRVDKSHELTDYYHLSSNFTRKAVNTFEKIKRTKMTTHQFKPCTNLFFQPCIWIAWSLPQCMQVSTQNIRWWTENL